MKSFQSQLIKKKLNSKIKHVKLLLFISLIIFLLLTILVIAKFSPIKNRQKRNLQYNYDHRKNINNQRTKTGEKIIISSNEDNTSMAITTYYGTYIILSLYIIGEIKFLSAGRPENLSIEVWKYIYMSNNGYLIFFIFIAAILKDKMIYSYLCKFLYLYRWRYVLYL